MALKPNFEELDQLKDGQPRTFVRSVARYNNDTGKYRKTAVMTKEQLEREIYYTFKANPPPKIKEKSWDIKDLLDDFEKYNQEVSSIPEALVENGVALANAVLNHSSAALSAFDIAQDFLKEKVTGTALEGGILNIMTQEKGQYWSSQQEAYDDAVKQKRADKVFVKYMEKKADKSFVAKLASDFILFSVAIATGTCPFFTPVGMLFTVVVWLNEKQEEDRKKKDYELAKGICDKFDQIRAKTQTLLDARSRNEQESMLIHNATQDSKDESWFGYWWDEKASVAYYVTFGQIYQLWAKADTRIEKYLDNELVLQGLAFGRIKTTMVKGNKIIQDNLKWDEKLKDDELMKEINEFWRGALDREERSSVQSVPSTSRFTGSKGVGANSRYVKQGSSTSH